TRPGSRSLLSLTPIMMNPDAKDFCPSWQTSAQLDDGGGSDSDDGCFWQQQTAELSAQTPAAAPAHADMVSMLANIFPEFSRASLESFLIAHNSDLMVCVERLLSLGETDSDTDQTPKPEQKPASKPVCKYFLNGHCLIANCQ
ncbi:hypothetical protein BVRB_035340, partial [Beta vulgaris subsp. vulgaris]